jgi:hypothetical protein
MKRTTLNAVVIVLLVACLVSALAGCSGTNDANNTPREPQSTVQTPIEPPELSPTLTPSAEPTLQVSVESIPTPVPTTEEDYPSEVLFHNILFPLLSGASRVSANDTLALLKFDTTLSLVYIYATDYEPGDSLKDIYSLMHRKIVLEEFSSTANETPFSQTVAGFAGDGSSFAAAQNGEQFMLMILSFDDGEYIYTIAFVQAMSDDMFSEHTNAFVNLIDAAEYVEPSENN